jgi:basic membrane protein A
MRTLAFRLALSLGLIGALVASNGVPRSVAGATKLDATPKVATFVSDVGGLNDNGFNHLGYMGTLSGAKQVGWTTKVIQTASPDDYDKNLTSAAQQSGIVIAVGFSLADAVKRVSAKFPKVKFTIIDSAYDPSLPNVLGNIFKPGEASYLAGILAAGISKTHTIGFVGGLNLPVIQEFLAGYQAGAKSFDPKVKVLAAYTGSFTDQSKGRVNAMQEINAGADVVYPAAGASGLGALTAADQKGIFGIGVDADQNFLHPKTVITSVVKHVEVAVAAAIAAAGKGTFKSGTKLWNLANNGVGLASYHDLASKVPARIQAAINKARMGIISGRIKVPTTPTK